MHINHVCDTTGCHHGAIAAEAGLNSGVFQKQGQKLFALLLRRRRRWRRCCTLETTLTNCPRSAAGFRL